MTKKISWCNTPEIIEFEILDNEDEIDLLIHEELLYELEIEKKAIKYTNQLEQMIQEEINKYNSDFK
jgi:hypothetical protein